MKIALVGLALALPTSAFGILFSWTDSAGIAHYANKEYEIPVRYRAKTKRLYPEQADTPAPQQNPQSQQTAKPEGQTPAQQLSPEVQIRSQPPAAISEQQQEARPAYGRRKRVSAPRSSEE